MAGNGIPNPVNWSPDVNDMTHDHDWTANDVDWTTMCELAGCDLTSPIGLEHDLQQDATFDNLTAPTNQGTIDGLTISPYDTTGLDVETVQLSDLEMVQGHPLDDQPASSLLPNQILPQGEIVPGNWFNAENLILDPSLASFGVVVPSDGAPGPCDTIMEFQINVADQQVGNTLEDALMGDGMTSALQQTGAYYEELNGFRDDTASPSPSSTSPISNFENDSDQDVVDSIESPDYPQSQDKGKDKAPDEPLKKKWVSKKPHPCTWEGCNRVCPCHFELQQHIREAHTGERPFRCQVCSVDFARQGTLNRHKKSASHRQKSQEEQTGESAASMAGLADTIMNDMSEQQMSDVEEIYENINVRQFPSHAVEIGGKVARPEQPRVVIDLTGEDDFPTLSNEEEYASTASSATDTQTQFWSDDEEQQSCMTSPESEDVDMAELSMADADAEEMDIDHDKSLNDDNDDNDDEGGVYAEYRAHNNVLTLMETWILGRFAETWDWDKVSLLEIQDPEEDEEDEEDEQDEQDEDI